MRGRHDWHRSCCVSAVATGLAGHGCAAQVQETAWEVGSSRSGETE